MDSKSGITENLIQLPKGGGAVSGIGEKFAPDLLSGTGNFSIPIAVSPGRGGLQPALTLGYSTGSGNGPYGLGWGLGIPGVMRQTAKGLPTYDDDADTFILSGAEDLVPVPGAPAGGQRYIPRTEGLFAEIIHYKSAQDDYWKVRTKEGLTSWYGTPAALGTDTATLADPDDRTRIFGWKLTRTEDPFGNHILYEYERDAINTDGPHHWEQLYLTRIRYADYDNGGTTAYLCSVEWEYETRPDPFSDYTAGFEVRTIRRCKHINTFTHPGGTQTAVKSHTLTYLDERVAANELPVTQLPLNGMSLLSRATVTGIDGTATEDLPPIDFVYSTFQPENRKFEPIGGSLPAQSLGSPDLDMVDLFGNGLPDLVQLNGVARYWRNLGNGTFDLPRTFTEIPAGVTLADPNVQFMDADGDGRPDLFVRRDNMVGYFPMRFSGEWEKTRFHKHENFPSFSFADPEVKLLDLDGDGITDVLRNGQRWECYFNHKEKGFHKITAVHKGDGTDFPPVSFSDPRVRTAAMSGGMQDIVMIYNGRIDYWPNLGYGKWGKRITMHNSPRYPDGFNPARIILADLDSDGYSDLVYVENGKITLWMNQSGNGWSEPITITGTPQVSDMDAVRVADLKGAGVPGIVWSYNLGTRIADQMLYLDLAGGLKPYLLNEMHNNMGAITRVEYASSTKYYLADYPNPNTRWRTPLPFPVLVVAKTEMRDLIAGGKLTTEYTYHHGYWDGAEREFRGFGRVDQRDTESFDDYSSAGLFPGLPTQTVPQQHYSPPTETRTWFHLGPIGDEFGDWDEVDYRHEYWQEDPNRLSRPAAMVDMLKQLPRRARRDALRTLRGAVLRTELYALDGTQRQNRPYSVAENQTGVAEFVITDDSGTIAHELTFDGTLQGPGTRVETPKYRVFIPLSLSTRSSAWERGKEPLTTLSFTDDYDEYAIPRRNLSIAVPRSRCNNWWQTIGSSTEPFLSVMAETAVAHKVDGTHYLIGRAYLAKSWEVENDGTPSAFELAETVLQAGTYLGTTLPTLPTGISVALQSWTETYYDGNAFEGLSTLGDLGTYGIPVRTRSLLMDSDQLTAAYGSGNIPVYLTAANPTWPTDYPTDFQTFMDGRDYAGYQVVTVGSTDYYFGESRLKYDFQTSGTALGLVLEQKDPFGAVASITYDNYHLLPIETTDPLGNTVTADMDYRLMAPWQVTDPNGNRTQMAYTPLGMPIKTAVMGKTTETLGDTLTDPGSWFEYDLFAFANTGDPVYVRTFVREHHINGSTGSTNLTLQTVEYSDGFGRLIQTRAQAEEVIFGSTLYGDSGLTLSTTIIADAEGTENTSTTAPNVIVSGWTKYNNKGAVVEQFEPYYSTGWDYDPTDAQSGQKMVQIYDAIGRVERSLSPDGTEARMVYGIPGTPSTAPDLTNLQTYQPTPWETYTYDANDLAPITHPSGGHNVPTTHFYTPRSEVRDCLGRTTVTVDRNWDSTNSQIEEVEMRYFYDIRGNRTEVHDALKVANPSSGRPAAFQHQYDYANRPLWTNHIDGGEKTAVFDVASQPIESRDAKGAWVLNAVDEAMRPTHLWARDKSGESITLRQHLVYGEDKTSPEATNHRGQLWKHYDEAGCIELPEYDFKGNPLTKKRRVIKDSVILAVFNGPPSGWNVPTFRVDWTGLPESTLLETDEYETSMEYDALNRAVEVTLPQDQSSTRKVVTPTYNRAGALEAIDLDGTEYVKRIAYNAKGQRLLVAYGNDIMTRYTYDSQNFRLLRVRSQEYAYTYSTGSPQHTYTPQSGTVRQDMFYEYDLAGNITQMNDYSPDAGIGGSGPLQCDFTYDPLYRLLSATGRESGQYNGTTAWLESHVGSYPSAPTGNGVGNTVGYTRTYQYDRLGNMLKLHHSVTGNNWSRYFDDYDNNPTDAFALKNTASMINSGGSTTNYTFDDCGNMLTEGSSRHFEWSYGDVLRAYRTQSGTSEPTVFTHYLYDAGGVRLKKITRNISGDPTVSVYIDGAFDHHYKVNATSGTRSYEHNEIHVMDDRIRIANLRIGTPFSGDNAPAVRYYLEDHLGNCSFTLETTGTLFSREEYFPFGETSFGSFAKKRYRFCGKERDEESGLYYYGARYYAPWTCRFVSVDPLAGEYPFYTPYQYAGNQPVIAIDLDGLEGSINSGFNPSYLPSNTNLIMALGGKRNFFLNNKIDNRSVFITFLKGLKSQAIEYEWTRQDIFDWNAANSAKKEIDNPTFILSEIYSDINRDPYFESDLRDSPLPTLGSPLSNYVEGTPVKRSAGINLFMHFENATGLTQFDLLNPIDIIVELPSGQQLAGVQFNGLNFDDRSAKNSKMYILGTSDSVPLNLVGEIISRSIRTSINSGMEIGLNNHLNGLSYSNMEKRSSISGNPFPFNKIDEANFSRTWSLYHKNNDTINYLPQSAFLNGSEEKPNTIQLPTPNSIPTK